MIRRDQHLVEGLGAASCRALLPRLLVSIDALVQAIDAYYMAHWRVFGCHRCSKKETTEKAAERHTADQDDMMIVSPPDLFWPYS